MQFGKYSIGELVFFMEPEIIVARPVEKFLSDKGYVSYSVRTKSGKHWTKHEMELKPIAELDKHA